MDIAKFSVKNSVLVNLLMIGLIIFGFLALNKMPVELNPDISFNWVFITVPYPGASPQEIESLISDPIESEIKDVNKVDEIQSTSQEGLAFILVKFEDMSKSEFNQLYNDLQAEVDKVDLPDEAEKPIVDDFSSGEFIPVIDVNMSFSIPDANAQKIAEDIEDDLKNIDGVAKVQVSGLGKREVWVEADPEKMNSYGVTFDEIVFAVKMRNLNVPGGNLAIGDTEYLIRSLGEYKSVYEIENTVVRKAQGGHQIKLKDVAKITDRREELEILAKTDNAKSITFSVSKRNDASSIEVIDNVKSKINEYQAKVQDGVSFSFFNDNSTYIMRVINILKNNAISGMILIFVILYLFLGKSNALLAALGIPISFLITFGILYITGDSLNGSSLFALVMVVGILVDDAIVILENCHRYRLMGYNAHDSAIIGAREVIGPVVSSIATNIAAFLPLMLLPGIMGKFMRIIPIVYSVALIASMFEAFVLLPSHYADWTKNSKVYERGERKFFVRLKEYYSKILLVTLRKRYIVFAGLILIFFSSLAAIPMLGIELFPEEDFDQFTCFIKMPEGTSLEETERVIKKYEENAMKLPKSVVQNVITNVGLYQDDTEWITRKNVGQIKVQLKPSEERTIETRKLMEQMREQSENISGPVSVNYKLISGGPPVGKPISIKVQGKYLDQIKAAALELQDSLKSIKGTSEISDDYPEGKKEINIKIDEERAALYGLSTQYIAMNVRYVFDGVEATKYRDGDDEIDVMVKYDEKNKKSLDDVLNLKITNQQGQTIALRDVVDFDIKPGPTTIRRFDQKRTIMVTGAIDDEKTSLDQVTGKAEQVFKTLEEKYSGVTFKFGGEFDEFMKTFNNMIPLFFIGIILIYIILGTQFNSYAQPILILITVPFALIGAVLGLLIAGNKFSIAALFGFVALAGIVVNDAIVLIDFFNGRRKIDGGIVNIWRSIIEAGRLRLRPIILTSITTIFGLIPMAWGIGGQSLQWAPLANVILWGLFVSTILTLFVIPALIAILDDIKKQRKKTKLINI